MKYSFTFHTDNYGDLSTLAALAAIVADGDKTAFTSEVVRALNHLLECIPSYGSMLEDEAALSANAALFWGYSDEASREWDLFFTLVSSMALAREKALRYCEEKALYINRK